MRQVKVEEEQEDEEPRFPGARARPLPRPLLVALALLAGALHWWPLRDESGPPQPPSEPFGWDMATMRLSAKRALSALDHEGQKPRPDFSDLLFDLARDEAAFVRGANEHEHMGDHRGARVCLLARRAVGHVHAYARTLAQAAHWNAADSPRAQAELAQERARALRFAEFTEQEVRDAPGADERACALQEAPGNEAAGDR